MKELLSHWYFENKNKRESFTKLAKSFDGKLQIPNL